MRLLDLGCGSGAAAEYFGRRRSADITCVTNSSIQGEIGRGKFQKFGGRLRVVLADFDDLSLPDASFDAIYAFESIGYSKDVDAWLSRCWRSSAHRIARFLPPRTYPTRSSTFLACVTRCQLLPIGPARSSQSISEAL
jgi:cyclopropane fatty-acyl-phospholipid synthase-like methyltransferase